MEVKGERVTSSCDDDQEEVMAMDLRRGPWTVDEDFALMNYIAQHGEGRWNSLARVAGLKRTGKSCRLRWLNYLRPDVRRGNITLEEQLLILELHSRWGNRWSKIAQHLPGRTDNEIKNYWRTRVQKHAKQLKCDVNSKQFKDTMRYLWMPRLVERIQAAATTTSATATTTASATATATSASYKNMINSNISMMLPQSNNAMYTNNFYQSTTSSTTVQSLNPNFTPENSSTTTASSESFGISHVSPASDLTDCCYNYNNQDYFPANNDQFGFAESLISPSAAYYNQMNFQGVEQHNPWISSGDVSDNLWNDEDFWFLQQQFNNNV